MSEILSHDEIGKLLDAIENPISEPSSQKVYYDFKRPEIVSDFQIEKLKKVFAEAISEISNYFTKLLERNFFFNFENMETETVEYFSRAVPNPSYIYSFLINGEFGYIEINPYIFNKIFLKRNDETPENYSIGRFERSVCLNYVTKVILERIKHVFYLDDKNCDYEKISYADLPFFKNASKMAVIATYSLASLDDKEDSVFMSFALPNKLTLKIKSNGVLKNNGIVI
jgi:flagellar motor switch protein FliM